jgi:hypothetical protein
MCSITSKFFACFWLIAGSTIALAEPIIHETFTGYPNNALISASPAGPAVGLSGDWRLDADSYFYVNRTQADLDGGTGKAVYDMPYDDNGVRKASRATSSDHVLFSADGDTFYASFSIFPPSASGEMLFTITLDRLDGGGQMDATFGISEGRFSVGNMGAELNLSGGTPVAAEMMVVLRVEYGDASSGSNDDEVVTLWVDPVNESSTPVIDDVPFNFLHRGGGAITSVSIRGDHMAGRPAFFDNLRVGLTFEDVTGATTTQAFSNDMGGNGMFFDPNNSGHGFDFNVHAAGLTALYFGHGSTGERFWLVSELFTGELEFDVPIELEMYEVTNGVFGNPLPPTTFWGTITISFADCDTGHASFNGIDGNLEMDFVRLTGLQGINCRQ